MAQLIKIYDCISRYETDPYRYPGQYIRMKKQQWLLLHDAWKANQFDSFLKQYNQQKAPVEEEKTTLFSKLKEKLKKNSSEGSGVMDIPPLIPEAVKEEEFEMQFVSAPRGEEELKQAFLDKIYQFQLKWASSTLWQKSELDRSLFRSKELKFFLQRFPDQYLFMYKPVLKVKQAVTELDLIFILPSEILCITLLKGTENSVFIGDGGHFWVEKEMKLEKKVLNPLISLNRTGSIISQIRESKEVELPVRKLLISEKSYIDLASNPYGVDVIDKRSFTNWFYQLRGAASPVKHAQLKAARAIFDYTVSDSYSRSEWAASEE
ncbi:NERD domain-containing protein [Metabacillus sp. GX 13764]|uniref:NERD domain-containing protein n=1 Tax=Metabacillus kandeliae TaxID=2900151 RepID=UPI001E2B4E30|nr:NERD domain-containing protein [Metabacillus kandeliae]MCD7032708.1 NERD domain-containing protein [Metabacillus kandeliae]